MLTTLNLYRMQRREMTERRPFLRRVRRVIAGVLLVWALSMFGISVARSLMRVDIPGEILGLDGLVWLIFAAFPRALWPLMVLFHLYLTASMANAASSVFLRRRRVATELVAITAAGLRGYTFARYLALVRTFLPHFLLIGIVYWGLAIYGAYEHERVRYAYFPDFWGAPSQLIVDIRPIFYFPEVELFAISAIVAIMGTLGMLALTAAIAVRAATIADRLAAVAALLLRIAIALMPIAAATLVVFRIPSLTIQRIGNLSVVSLADGGLHLATVLLQGYEPFIGEATPVALSVVAGVLLYLAFCAVLAASFIMLSNRRLRPR